MSAPDKVWLSEKYADFDILGDIPIDEVLHEYEEYLLRNGETVATLIAQARAEALEEAAEVAENHLPKDHYEARDSTAEYNLACRHIAAAIRARKDEA